MAGPETETGLAAPDVEAVLDFLRKNGLKDAELALKEDMNERNTELGSFDFEKFLFVLPPVRIPANGRQLLVEGFGGGGERSQPSSGSPSADEFVSLGSSTTASGVYSSEFSNPYGLHSASQANSKTSSDRLSQFGTARDYRDFDLQNDFCWYDEKEEGHFMTPCFNGPDYFSCPSEDKFVMTSETEKQFENYLGLYDESEGETEGTAGYLDKQCLFNVTSVNNKNKAHSMSYYHFDRGNQLEGDIEGDGSSASNCKCCEKTGGTCSKNPVDCIHLSSKETDLGDFQLKGGEGLSDMINNLINIFGKAGRLEDALKLFDQMRSWKCAPNVVTYNTVIKALFESKAPASEAASWFEKMKANGVTPSSFTYSILIDGFCKTNRVEKALLLLEEMDEKGFPPCPAAYCSLINALGKAKRYEAANELFLELKENCGRSSARIYAVMIKNLGKCGRPSEAVDLFNEMKKIGCNPDVYAYNALMSGLVRAGMIEEAFSALRTMEENGCTPDLNSHNIILNGLARAGRPEQAAEMFMKMKDSLIKPDAVSYNTILGSLSRSGMFEEAAKLMREMGSRGFEYDHITYSSILEAVGKVDEDDEPNFP